MTDIVERLRFRADENYEMLGNIHEPLLEAAAEIEQNRIDLEEYRLDVERLRAALELYRDAVRIDATMEGPKFMGANTSALKRAWDADRAALETREAAAHDLD